MMKKTTLASWLLSLLVVTGFVGMVKADLNPTGTVIRQVFDAASGQFGKYRFDSVNNYFVFGSSRAPFGTNAVGAVVLSSGTLIVQSTSTVTTNEFFRLLSATGAKLLSFNQLGNLTLATGKFVGDGSLLTNLPASGVTKSSTFSVIGPDTYFTTSATVPGPSFSTVTFTTNGVSKVRVCYWGGYNNTTATASTIFKFTQDGLYAAPYTSTMFAHYLTSPGVHWYNGYVCVVYPPPSAGSHSYSFLIYTNAGTSTVGAFNSTALVILGAEEI